MTIFDPMLPIRGTPLRLPADTIEPISGSEFTMLKPIAFPGYDIDRMATASLYPQNPKPAQTNIMARGAAFRILPGVGGAEPAAWDGSVSVAPGRIAEIRGVRFSGKDATDGTSSWKASTHRA